MLKLSFLLPLINAISIKLNQNTAPQNDCVWYSGTYGQVLTCQHGMVLTGVCGSGSNKDCGKYAHEIQCCPVSNWSSCNWIGGDYLVLL